LAHLKRDIQAIIDKHIGDAWRYGNRLMDVYNEMFHLYHLYLKDITNVSAFTKLLECGYELKRVAIEEAPMEHRDCRNMSKRFLNYGESYLTFIRHLQIDPTNNVSEQAVRFVVIDRLITQGVRSMRGRVRWGRLWTVIATCRKQKISPFKFFRESIIAKCKKMDGPSLLPKE
jgi:hypothetical protein